MYNLFYKSLKVREIIYQAGEILMTYIDQEKKIHYKTDINLLTEADKKSEELICQMLRKNFPQDSILAEEGFEYEGDSGDQWIIDPIDGTTSFAHNFPMFAISVGLINKKKEPIIGFVYNPYSKELFHSILGNGAFLNEKRIYVSSITSIEKSLIGTGFPYTRKEKMPILLKRLENILRNTQDIRRTGSAALDICFVAMGRYEGYYEEDLKIWDVAAAVLIASEAGAKKSKLNGDNFKLFDGEILITNSKIHQALIKLVNA